MKRGRQVRLFTDPTPRTLPTLKIRVEFLPLLLQQVNVNGMVCDLRGVTGGPFIGWGSRFPPSLYMEMLITAFERIMENHRPRRTWTGASLGSAGPTWPPLATAFGRVTDRWVLFFDICGPGSCTSVCSDEWAFAHLHDWIFCAFALRLVYIFVLFHTWVFANQESPKLVELVRIKSYYYVWWSNVTNRCRSWWFYFWLKDHQQRWSWQPSQKRSWLLACTQSTL